MRKQGKKLDDRHIKTKVFAQGDKVLLYDSRVNIMVAAGGIYLHV
jgi:hypothetical protein